MQITKSQLVNKPRKWGRHIVILGAGASIAAFPDGDINGKRLPTMSIFRVIPQPVSVLFPTFSVVEL